MKTNLLTLLIFAIASVLYSCSKESEDSYASVEAQNNPAKLTTAQRRIIISNCSSHSGCHSSSRVMQTGTMFDMIGLLKSTIDASNSLSICDRSKMQLWFNSELAE